MFKVFIEFVTILLLFCVFDFFFFGPEACGILAPQPGIEPAPPALEGSVLTTGSPGTPLLVFESGLSVYEVPGLGWCPVTSSFPRGAGECDHVVLDSRSGKGSDAKSQTWFVLRLLPHPREHREVVLGAPAQGSLVQWLPCIARNRVWSGFLRGSCVPPNFPASSPLPALRPSLPLWGSTFQPALCLACSEQAFFFLVLAFCQRLQAQPLILPCMWAVDFQLLGEI